MCYSQIWQNLGGDEYLCKLGKKVFKCFNMQICHLFSTAFWNFWRITCLSTTNRRWVINAQTGPVFWPTLYRLHRLTTPGDRAFNVAAFRL